MNKKVVALFTDMRVLLLCLTPAILLTSCNANTHSDERESFTFIQICDTQLGFSDYDSDKDSFRRAVRQINELNPDFVVICGDLVNTANDSSFSDFKEIKRSFQMPCYCVPGNHDIGNQPTLESLAYYRKTIGKDYFVIEHKGATFIFVNTQLWKEPVQSESEKQDIWLKERLNIASRKGYPIFIVGHYPLFCREADEPDEYMNLPLEKRRELLALYDQYNVAAVLNGHTHRLILNKYKEIQLVGAETISKNFDKRPLGFRTWFVEDKLPPQHAFVPLHVTGPLIAP
jgi:predicted phosphodiesterase